LYCFAWEKMTAPLNQTLNADPKLTPTLTLDGSDYGNRAGAPPKRPQLELHLEPNYRNQGRSRSTNPPSRIPEEMVEQVEHGINIRHRTTLGERAGGERVARPYDRHRSSIGVTRTMLALAVLGIVGGFFYLLDGARPQLSDPAALPLVVADAGAFKVKPANPGGMEVPHQDVLVYQELLGQKPEGEAQVAGSAEAPINVTEQIQETHQQTAVDAAEAPPPTAQAPANSNKIEVPNTAPATAELDAEPVKPAVISPQPVVSPPAAPIASEVKPSSPVAKTPPKPAAASKPATKTASSSSKFALPPSSGAVRQPLRLQLAAVRTEADAQAEWKRLQAKFPALREYSLDVQPLPKPVGGYHYRVMVGSMPDRAAATGLCQSLQAKKQACSLIELGGA
jgi:cell division septation protein DedD